MINARRFYLTLAIATTASLGMAFTLAAPSSGFNRTLPVYPAGPDGPSMIQARLTRVIDWLRGNSAAGLAPAQLEHRERMLAYLAEYRDAGFFPINEKHPGRWAPAFIDSRGAICAVGYLVERTEGRAVAERINERYHDATIEQIDDPALAAWIERSGLTRDEVIAIQEPGWNGSINDLTGIRIAGLDTAEQSAIASRVQIQAQAKSVAGDTTVVVPIETIDRDGNRIIRLQ